MRIGSDFNFYFTVSIISKQPILEQLETVWKDINERGWINIQATQSLESLLNTGGSILVVCFERSKGGFEVSLPEGARTSCRLSICHFSSRH